MARTRFVDALQSHLFWAFDATNAGFPVFNPLFGFSRISAPQISAELESFKDGTFVYNRHVVKGGAVGPVTFERAASMFDADFYDWIITTIHGNKDFEDGGTLGKVANILTQGGRVSPRRSLLVVQFANINIGNLDISDDPLMATAAAVDTAVLATITGAAFGATAGVGAALGAGALLGVGIGPFKFATRIPARAWLLRDCLPTRYKAASDFDASVGAISLQELEVQPESIEEFSLGAKP